MKTWFITGASRGLGLEIARAALEAGDNVAATARNLQHIEDALPGHGDRLLPLRLDVTDPTTIAAAVEAAKSRFQRIDILVNNAGYGQLGTFEEVSSDTVARQFATNVFGVFDVTRAILPIMRTQRAGHVVNIASTAGVYGFEGASIYVATKHAIAGWSESLSREVSPFGIKVTSVYPGMFRTDFLDDSSVRFGDQTIDDYAAFSAGHRQALDAGNHQQSGDPVKFGALMLELVKAEQPPIWLAAGSDAYEVFTGKSKALSENAERWKSLTLSTDFEA